MDTLLPDDAAEGWRGRSPGWIPEDFCPEAGTDFCGGCALPKTLSGIMRCPGKDMVLMNAGPGALGNAKGSFDPAKEKMTR